MGYLLSFDLGTGGIKAGLFRTDGSRVSFEFMPYATYYPQPDWHEQKPEEWWQAVCDATRRLLHTSGVKADEIGAIAASGHSLVAAPLDREGHLLLDSLPIWSDRRAKEEAAEFFSRVDYESWYKITGNGDPPETYSIFKLMWLKKHQPEVFARTTITLGSKDYINYRLTGVMATDYSYASGSGAFDLRRWTYDEAFIEAAGLPHSLLIEPGDSFAQVGTVSEAAARETGLRAGTPVFCGGVDNSCMALGTTGIGSGRVYTSLGSSAWIAISAREPILDIQTRPFVFAHVEKGYYTTGVSIFSAANGYRWAKEVFAADLKDYGEMDKLAATAPLGANGVMFNPSLAGGSSQEPSHDLEGTFFGLKLSTTRAELLRAILEGVALSLRCFCLSVVEPLMQAEDAMILCGGGAKSELWMQIFADVYGRKVVVTNVDQDAASLGAAAIAARGAGYWPDYSPLDRLFAVQKTFTPDPQRCNEYQKIAGRFEKWVRVLSSLHDDMRKQQIHERMEK